MPPVRQVEVEDNLNIRELELLHNFIINVTGTIADVPHVIEIWKGPVVKEALRYPFLMHGLLSLSALHLALNGPPEDVSYRELAIRQERAMELYRPILNEITKDNCHALFLFSCFVPITAFAFPRLPGQVKSPETIMNELIDIVVFIKGTCLVLDQAFDWICQGPVAGLLRIDLLQTNIKALTEEQEQICKLLRVRNQQSTDPPSVKSINTAAIAALAHSFTLHWDKTALPFIWPHIISEEFHSLLRLRNPMALTILAHYGVQMSACDEKWWSRGWGRQAVWSITQIIDEEYLPAIAWPMEKLGLRTETVQMERRSS